MVGSPFVYIDIEEELIKSEIIESLKEFSDKNELAKEDEI